MSAAQQAQSRADRRARQAQARAARRARRAQAPLFAALLIGPLAQAVHHKAPAPGGPKLLFESRLSAPSSGAAAERAKLFPAGDDWENEQILLKLEPRAREFAGALFDVERMRALLADAFSGSNELVPEALERFEHAGIEVQRGAARADALVPPGEFPAQWQRFAAFLERGEAPALEALFESCQRTGPDRAEVEMRLEWRQPRAGRALHARWSTTWTWQQDQAPKLAALRAHEFALARGRPLVLDATEAVFGANECWRREFLHGVADTLRRIDRHAGSAFQGMQGLSVGDVDGDGLDDVYVPQQVGLPNRLFRHGKDDTALDVAARSRVHFMDVTRSALFIDVDNDGDQDLVAAVANSILVRKNDGQGEFPPATQLWYVAQGAEQFYSIAAADPDRDGDLDVYACRYSMGGVMHGAPRPYHDAKNGASNYYWRNDGAAGFTDATAAAGLDADNRRFSLGALWEDLDGDLDLDLYVVNDFGRNNAFLNDGAGQFEDAAARLGLEDIGAGMGASFGDYDLDGDLDLYVTNMYSAAGLRATRDAARWMGGQHEALRGFYFKHASGNTLLENRSGTFVDVSARSGSQLGRWAWGGTFTDFDGDARPDLVVPNGQTTNPDQALDAEGYFWRRVVALSPPDETESETYKQAFDAIQEFVMNEGYSWNGHERNLAYLNLGDGSFADVSAVAGLDFDDDARCVATLDWDGDLREDLLFKNRSAPRLRLLLNRAESKDLRLGLELVGDAKRSNRDAIGAKVVLELGTQRQTKRVYAGSGYLCQSSKRLYFRFPGSSLAGTEAAAARAVVDWPDGTREEFADLSMGSLHRLVQGEGKPSRSTPAAQPRFTTPSPARAEAGKISRVVLVERVPLGPFPVPAFVHPARAVRDFAGSNVLLVCFSSTSAEDQARLTKLFAHGDALGAARTRVVPLSIDDGPALGRARAFLKGTPVERDAGFLDARSKLALEILTLEVLGPFDPVPLPTAYLLDAAGQLCAMYIGFDDPQPILADCATLASMPTNRGTTTRLEGGVWVFPRQRKYKLINDVFRANGFEELADWFMTWHQKRSSARSPQGGDEAAAEDDG